MASSLDLDVVNVKGVWSTSSIVLGLSS